MDALRMSADYDLISARAHYVSTPQVVDFCHYLADYLCGRLFESPYLTQTYKPKCQYVFVSLQDAWEQYGLEKANQEVLKRLELYQEPLRKAVIERSDEETSALIEKLFAQKLLASNSQDWLLSHHTGLADLLHYACEKLTDPSPDFFSFGRDYGPRMTVSFSKIYAILIGDFLSYESRVVAGLCYFVRSWCIEKGIDLPPDLQFGRLQGWGKDKKNNGRNASWGANVFPSIDRIKKKPARESHFARSNILATWVVFEALRLAKERMKDDDSFWLHTPDAMRRIEAALYMMGAELPIVQETH